MKPFALICDIRRLDAYASDKVWFVLTLATSYLSEEKLSEEIDEEPVLPWNWKSVGPVSVAHVRPDGMAVQSIVTAETWAYPFGGVSAEDLVKELNETLSHRQTTGGIWEELRRRQGEGESVSMWDPVRGPGHETDAELPLRNVIAEVATRPPPYPYATKLCHVFGVDGTFAEDGHIIAAPAITLEDGTAGEPDDAAGKIELHVADREMFRWTYKGAGVDAHAYCAHIKNEPRATPGGASASLFDFTTGFVLNKAVGDTETRRFGQEWNERLLQSAADGMDLSRWLIESLESILAGWQSEIAQELQHGPYRKAARDIQTALKPLRRLFLASLRDLAHTRHLVAPDGAVLMRQLVDRALPDDAGAKLIADRWLAALEHHDATVKLACRDDAVDCSSWVETIQEIVGDENGAVPPWVADVDSAPPGVFEPEHLRAEVTSWNGLFDALADPATLSRLIVRQIREARTRFAIPVPVNADVAEDLYRYTDAYYHAPQDGSDAEFELRTHGALKLTGTAWSFESRVMLPSVGDGWKVSRFSCRLDIRSHEVLDTDEKKVASFVVVKTGEDKYTMTLDWPGSSPVEREITLAGHEVDLRVSGSPNAGAWEIVAEAGGAPLELTVGEAARDFRSVSLGLTATKTAGEPLTVTRPRFGDDSSVVGDVALGIIEQSVLPTMQVRRSLSRAAMGRAVWRRLQEHRNTESSATPEERLVANFVELVDEYLETRARGFNGRAWSDRHPRLEISPEAWQALRLGLGFGDDAAGDRKPVIEFARRNLVEPSIGGQTEDDLRPEPRPHAVTVQVDRIAARSHDDTAGDRSDFLRGVFGVGVFLRQHGPTDWSAWRCLNHVVTQPGNEIPNRPDDGDLRIAPTRIVYQDDQKAAFVTYNGHPLAAGSAAQDLYAAMRVEAERVRRGDDRTALDLAHERPLFHYHWPKKQPEAKLPQLVFGQRYQWVTFMIQNGGVLPEDLAGAWSSTTHPALLDLTKLTDLEPGTKYVHEFEYLCRVRVAAPRLLPSSGRRTAIPPIPRDVSPIAAEQPRDGIASGSGVRRYFFDPSRLEGRLRMDEKRPRRWSMHLRDLRGSRLGDSAGGVRLALRDENDLTSAPIVFLTVRRNEETSTFEIICGGRSFEPFSISDESRPLDSRLEVDLYLDDITKTDGKWYVTPRYRLRARYGREALEKPAAAHGKPVQISAPRKTAHVAVEVLDSTASVSFASPEVSWTAGDGILNSEPRDETDRAIAVLVPEPVESGTSALSFAARRPTVELETWDAWVASDERLAPDATGKDVIREIRVDAFKGSLEARGVRTDDPRKPLGATKTFSLDHPAVDRLLIELVPLDTPLERVSTPAEPARLMWPRETPTEFPPPVRKLEDQSGLAVTVTCKERPWHPEQRLVLDSGESTLDVSVVEGEIWLLRVHALVDTRWFGGRWGRFPSALAKAYPELAVGESRRMYVVSTEEVTLEAASFAMPPAAGIWSSLRPVFDGAHVRVDWSPPNPETILVPEPAPDEWDWRFRHVDLLTLKQQTWRWSGHPFRPFPFLSAEEAHADTDARREWDVEGFGQRFDDDAVSSRRKVDIAPRGTTVLEDDVQDDQRSLYFRYAAEARSRYEPLFAESSRARVAGADPRFGENADLLTGWRRLVVPCRLTKGLPTPAVRLLVPLTQPVGEDDRAAPVLAVVEEEWFQRAGLAEDFEVEAALAYELPNRDGVGTTRVLDETGPDPVLVGKVESPTFVEFPEPVPIGHTFDTDSTAPRFVATSFLLEAPSALDGEEWPFAKLRFRRVVRPEARPISREAVASADADGAEPIELGEQPEWEFVVHHLTFGATRPSQVIWRITTDQSRFVEVVIGTPESKDGPAPISVSAPVLDAEAQYSGAYKPSQHALSMRIRLRQERVEVRDKTLYRVSVRAALKLDDQAWRPLTVSKHGRLAAELETPFLETVRQSVVVDSEERGVAFTGPMAAPVLASEFTKGSWVQFLPDMSRPRFNPSTDEVEIAAGDTDGTLVFQTPLEQSLTMTDVRDAVTAESGGYLGHERLLLVTRRIYDLSGLPDEESFFGLFESLDGNSWKSAVDGPTFDWEDGCYRGRVIRIQERIEWLGSRRFPDTVAPRSIDVFRSQSGGGLRLPSGVSFDLHVGKIDVGIGADDPDGTSAEFSLEMFGGASAWKITFKVAVVDGKRRIEVSHGVATKEISVPEWKGDRTLDTRIRFAPNGAGVDVRATGGTWRARELAAPPLDATASYWLRVKLETGSAMRFRTPVIARMRAAEVWSRLYPAQDGLLPRDTDAVGRIIGMSRPYDSVQRD